MMLFRTDKRQYTVMTDGHHWVVTHHATWTGDKWWTVNRECYRGDRAGAMAFVGRCGARRSD